MVDDGDLDRAGAGLQLQSELRLDSIEDTGAVVSARISVDSAEKPDVEVPSDASAVDHWPAGDAGKEIAKVAQTAGAAQFRGAAGGRRKVKIVVEFEGRGQVLVHGLQLGAGLTDNEGVDRKGSRLVVNRQLEAIDEQGAQHRELYRAGLRRGRRCDDCRSVPCAASRGPGTGTHAG